MGKFFEERSSDIVDWTTIKAYQEEGTVAGFCMALSEAHKLLDFILSDQGYQGDTIRQKINQSRERFTELKELIQGVEAWEKVFSRYDERVTKREVAKAISAYQQAVFDLSSDTDYVPLTVIDRLKSWIDLQLVSKPENRHRLTNYFFLTVILVLVLDNTHFGQKFIHWLAGLLNGIAIWAIGIIVGLIVIILVISNLISSLEGRK
jgi:hypothetical protein